eukprot:UN06516
MSAADSTVLYLMRAMIFFSYTFVIMAVNIHPTLVFIPISISSLDAKDIIFFLQLRLAKYRTAESAALIFASHSGFSICFVNYTMHRIHVLFDDGTSRLAVAPKSSNHKRKFSADLG